MDAFTYKGRIPSVEVEVEIGDIEARLKLLAKRQHALTLSSDHLRKQMVERALQKNP